MMPRSALYKGRVVHARLRPRKHKLSYACYWLLVDLDELPALNARLRLFSFDRFNLFSIFSKDHGDGSGRDLRLQAQEHLSNAGIDLNPGKIFLLTMPRILGYGFNPLSVYFCYSRDGSCAALLYEVHNTFGQRHSYLIPVAAGEAQNREISQSCQKRFYVSPFMDLNLSYAFDVAVPGDDVRVSVRVSDAQGLLLSAALAGTSSPLTDATLAKIFFTHPLLTAKVVSAIHWEALRLWWKGVRLVPRPAPPEHAITIANKKDAAG